MEEAKIFKLRRLISELESVRGRHTELVSLYIPAGADLPKVLDMLYQESALAQRVKDKTVRKNVISALEKIIAHLKFFKQTPPNGLVVFCGNVSPEPGRADVRLWSVEPPLPMGAKLYRCDQVFILEPLKELIKVEENFGLIVVDAQEAHIGLLRGKALEVLKKMESYVPRKTIKGGMSAARYQRIREEALHEFLKKVGEAASQLLLPLSLKGILVGGPGPVKEQFARGEYLCPELKTLLLGVRSTGYTDEYGLQELVERSTDLLKKAAVAHEIELLTKFFIELQKGGAVAYGIADVSKALKSGAVDVLLLSEAFDLVLVHFKCGCGARLEKTLPTEKIQTQNCPKCGKRLMVERTMELVDELVEVAKKVGTRVEFVSASTREGAQFKELGGIGGFLRYKL